jgi:hypothetical protein
MYESFFDSYAVLTKKIKKSLNKMATLMTLFAGTRFTTCLSYGPSLFKNNNFYQPIIITLRGTL